MKKSELIFLCGLVSFSWCAHGQNANPAPAPVAATSASVLPQMPKGNITTSEALRLREELELIRKDTEQKIVRLEAAKKAYDASKESIAVELKKVEEEKRLLDETLQKEKNLKGERLKETVDFISKMEPKKSALLFESMDRDLVLALLNKLAPRLVTKILENLSPAKATQYLEYYTHIRSGREFDMLKDLGLCSLSKENDESVQSKK
jgi:flagellar motility protein MotE (MotC chaperone)